jgi:hypothetical protein
MPTKMKRPTSVRASKARTIGGHMWRSVVTVAPYGHVGVDAPPEVFRASLLNGADSRLNGMVNPLNVTDQLFRRMDTTSASDAAVFAEFAGDVADGIFAVGLG